MISGGGGDFLRSELVRDFCLNHTHWQCQKLESARTGPLYVLHVDVMTIYLKDTH